MELIEATGFLNLPFWGQLTIAAVLGFCLGQVLLYPVSRYRKNKLKLVHQAELDGQQQLVRQAENDSQNLALELATATNEASRTPVLEKQLQAVNTELNSQQQQVARLQTQMQADRQQAEEKIALLKEARDEMSLQFKSIANDLLEEKSKTFSNQNKDQLGQLLNPLKEQIHRFEKQVDDKYNQEAKERHSLVKEILQLKELNSQISAEANNLTTALTGQVKTQGNWGELILEKVLESSGLEKGREYDTEVHMVSDEGKRYRPDVVVYLPGDKAVIVDSKVSLTAYERYSSSDNEIERQKHLAEHIQSLRNHVKNLSDKRYDELLGERSLDFVFLFVPVEAAFVEAVRHDVSLYDEAFQRNIGLVTPSTLLGMLRTIQNIWRSEYQNKNAIEIGRKAGKLYDKFVGFVEDIDKIGVHMDRAQKAHEDAKKKLSDGTGNLVRTSEQIKKLGARASKQLDNKLLDTAADE